METVTPTEQFITEVFETQPDFVVLYQPLFLISADKRTVIDFKFAWCNRYAEKLLGSSRLVILGQTLQETNLFDDDTRKRVYEQCTRVWQSSQPLENSYYNTHFDRYFSVQLNKIDDGVLCISRDNTRLKQLEIEKEKEDDLVARLIEQSPYGICLYESIRDSSNKVTDFKLKVCNQKSADIIGFTAEELRRTPLTGLLNNKQLCLSFENFKSVVEKKEASFTEYYCDRQHVWLGVSVTRFDDGFLMTFIDISSSKKLEESATTLQTILDATETGICLLEAVYDGDELIKDFIIRNANKATAKYRGMPSINMNNTLVSKWLPSFRTDNLFAQFTDTLKTGEQKRSNFHYGNYGLNFWFDVVSTRLDNHVLITLHDVSDEKKLQLQLENSVSDLKNANANLEEFTYAASHDLQEPLRKINYFSDRLRKKIAGVLSEEDTNMFVRMESAAARMQILINDLLTYSRVSNKTVTQSRIVLDDLIKVVLQDLEATIALKGANIVKSSLPVIDGDPVQIRQLFINLLGNSLKYNKVDSPPEIIINYKRELRLENDKNISYHVISVSDSGIGFDQKYAAQIFKVFQRLHGLSEYPGTGVGLAIAQKVVENHRGFIEVESALNEGATFRIYLPC